MTLAADRSAGARLMGDRARDALRRRGAEALGLVLLALGVALAAMLASFSAEDPSPFNATGDTPANLLGLVGSHAAGVLVFALGWAAVALPAGFLIWGLRFLLHRGEERALTRILLMLLGTLVLAAFLSTHVPPAGWPGPQGLGGAIGDSLLRNLLLSLPVAPAEGLAAASLGLGLGALALATLGLGMDAAELGAALRFLGRGAAFLMRLALGAVGAVLRGTGRLAGLGLGATMRGVKPRRDAPATRPDPEDRPDGSLFARIPRRRRREPGTEPSLLSGDEPRPASATDPVADPEDPGPTRARRSDPRADPRAGSRADPQNGERLMARIAAAVRARETRPRADPPLDAGNEPAPGPVEAAEDAPWEDAWDDDPGHDDPGRDDAGRDDPGRAGLPAADPAPQDGCRVPRLGPAIERGGGPFQPDPEEEDVEEAGPRPVVRHRPARPLRPSRQARSEAQPGLPLGGEETPVFDAPPLSLLTSPGDKPRLHMSDEALEENARLLESVLEDYGIRGEITAVRPGPVVTLYELEPAPGLKAARVIGLADDIARSMSALSARIATVPGRSVIGIELPNATRERVLLREILGASAFGDSPHPLPLALGKDIGGDPVVANLARMPHLLIAGTTGSGKSVAINTMILSLLYRLSPLDCRLIMIDPKMLELSVYDGIPHLLSPVVTDPKKAVVALKWTVAEMEERYRRMSKMGVRNIEGYNAKVRDALARGEAFSRVVQTGFEETTGEPIFEEEAFAPETMPYIVVIVDEMADLMMVAGKEIEACIQRLAQMARASGIHLIMATQRPSVDVITGTIKANFPTRISFQVTSKIDSRTILGEQGAEQLLGQGDMLYMAGGARITRVHAPFCSDEEVEEVVAHLKMTGAPDYVSGVQEGPDEEAESEIDMVLGLGGNTGGEDALYDQAVAIVARDRKCSTSYIQRKLGIGYQKAARLVEKMEDEGVVTPANQVGKREILIPER